MTQVILGRCLSMLAQSLLWVAIAPNVAAHALAVGETETPNGQPLRVLDQGYDLDLGRAGIYPGDILLNWSTRGSIPRPFRSVLHFREVVLRHAVIEPVWIELRRSKQNQIVRLPPLENARLAPILSPILDRAYLRAARAGSLGNYLGAANEWERMAATEGLASETRCSFMIEASDQWRAAGEYGRAVVAARRARDISSRPFTELMALESLARIYAAEGQSPLEEATWRRALEVASRSQPNGPLEIYYLRQLASFLARYRWRESEELFWIALVKTREVAPGSFLEAQVRTRTARPHDFILWDSDRQRNAPHVRKSAAILRQVAPNFAYRRSVLSFLTDPIELGNNNAVRTTSAEIADLDARTAVLDHSTLEVLEERYDQLRQNAPGSIELAEQAEAIAAVALSENSRGEWLARALAIYERRAPNSLYVARVLMSGTRLDDEPEFLVQDRKALLRASIVVGAAAPNSLLLADVYGLLATVSRLLDAAEDHELWTERALRIWREKSPRRAANELSRLGFFGWAYERPDIATYLEEAHTLFAKMGAPATTRICVLHLLAATHRANEPRRAIEYLEQAMSLVDRTAPVAGIEKQLLQELQSLQAEVGDSDAAIESRRRLDERLQSRGASAWTKLERAALLLEAGRREAATTLVREVEDQLQKLHRDSLTTWPTFASGRRGWDLVAIKLADLLLQIQDSAAALELVDSLRTASYEAIAPAGKLSALDQKVADALRSEHDELLAKLEFLSPRRQPEASRQIRRRLEALRFRHAQLRRGAPKHSIEPAGLRVSEIQQALDPGSALIVFAQLERPAVFVVRRDRAIIGRQLDGPRLGSDVQRFRELIVTRNRAATSVGRELYSRLFGPIAKEIQEAERLLIAPDLELWSLPFGALVVGESAPSEPKFLARWKPFSIIASGTLAARLRLDDSKAKRATTSLTAAVFGDPAYSVFDRSKSGMTSYEVPGGLGLRRDPFRRLPGTREEAEAVASIYGLRGKTFLGREATEELLTSSAEVYDVLHVAAHGLPDCCDPLGSGLALTPRLAEEHSAPNGLLQVWEIIDRLSVRSRLVVLSACSTGRWKSGMDSMSIALAFRQAGARSVVGSLWPIDDLGTVELMSNFHESYVGGMSTASALQKAQAEALSRGGELASPFFWAGFQVYGDWR